MDEVKEIAKIRKRGNKIFCNKASHFDELSEDVQVAEERSKKPRRTNRLHG